MKTVKRSLIFLMILILPIFANADDGTAALCQQGIEGSYQGTLGTLGARINFICIDGSKLVATVCPYGNRDGSLCGAFINLSNSAIDENQLLLANFLLDKADRAGGSSKSTIGYAKLEIDPLKKGLLRGIYINGTMDFFSNLRAEKIQSYPALTSALKVPLDSGALTGSYRVNSAKWKNTVLVFDVLLGAPVISLVAKNESTNFHFTVGPVWKGDGTFESASPEGNGGEPDDRKLNYIRGRFLDDHTIEFYLISPDKGLEGPMKATRQ